jgi:type 1 fimbria pilin
MINQMQKTVFALAVLAATSLPAMADITELKVTGTITPSACETIIDKDGIFDYETIEPSSLFPDSPKQLEVLDLNFNIFCDAPTTVGVKLTSQRPNTILDESGALVTVAAAPETIILFGQSNVSAFGLGLDAGKPIGGYGISFFEGTIFADGKQVDIINKIGNGAWKKSLFGSLIEGNSDNLVTSFATPGQITPVPLSNVQGTISSAAYINPTSTLDLTKPIKLDGLAVMELEYL